MAPRFKIKSISRYKILKNASVSFILILSFLLVFFSKSDFYLVNKFKSVSYDFTLPISRAVSFPMIFISETTKKFNEYKNLKYNNTILREEVMRLKKWQTLAIQNSRENKVLKTLLNATDNNLELIKTASVLSRNDMMFAKMININAGLNQGIKKNMVAVNHRGLIGKVISPTKKKSKILLLTDPNFSISVKTISDDIYSLLHGAEDGKHLVSSFIKDDKMPKIGDLLITSGSAQVFPPDILVGKIVKTEDNRYFVLPFVDFDNIDYVQIVESK